MLSLTRRVGETIHIGDEIIVTVAAVTGKQVKLNIEAPRELAIYRREIYLRIQDEKEQGNGTQG
jgi:carbon storage regulator